VTLHWRATGADSLRLDQGIGTVTGNSIEVTVNETTTFTLTAARDSTTVESQTTVFAAIPTSAPRPFDLGEPSSTDLIDLAVAEGEIDDVTALRYKVFALYGDDRLPVEFQAQGSIHGSPIMKELAVRFEDLPPQVQTELRPFRLPPDDPESWYAATGPKGAGPTEERFTEVQIEADGRVWVSWDARLPEVLEEYIRFWVGGGADTAWDLLTELMGREPLSPLEVLPEQPLEVFVTVNPSKSDLGWCSYDDYDIQRQGYPSFVYVNLYAIIVEDDDGAFTLTEGHEELTLATVAHELMHAIQAAFDTVDVDSRQLEWLGESTATWAEHYVYPTFNTEHDYADDFLEMPELPLDDTRGVHEYGGYLFPFYLTGLFPDSTIRTIWENTESDKVFEAVDKALGGRLHEEWASFTAYNWNDIPLDDYASRDGLMESVADETDKEKIEITAQQAVYEINLAGASDAGPILGVDYLSAQYFHFDLTDTSIHSILFANGYTFELKEGSPQSLLTTDTTYYAEELSEDEKEGAHVQALVKAEGDWELLNYDLTDVAFVPFCQDYREESIEEIVLIFSNSRFQDGNRTVVASKGLEPRLFVSNVGCGDWLGDITVTRNIDGAPELYESTEAFINNLEFTRARWPRNELLSGEGQFEFGGLLVPGGVVSLDFVFGNYTLENADITWSTYIESSDSTGLCISEGEGEAGLSSIGLNLFDIRPNLLSSAPGPGSVYRSYFIQLSMMTDEGAVDVTCTDSPPTTRAFGVNVSGGGRGGPVVFEVSDDGLFIDQQWSPDLGTTNIELSLVGVAD
jgi:hypothetical protein